MRIRAIHAYVGTLCVLALFALSQQAWAELFSLPPQPHLLGLLSLVGLGLVSESLSISFKVGKETGQSSITFLPLLTGMLIFGSAGTVLFILISGLIGEFLIRKKPPIKAVFNNAQWVVATAVSGWIFSALGGTPLAFLAEGQSLTGAGLLLPFAAFTLVFLAMNHTAVAIAIAVSQRQRFSRILSEILGPTGTNVLYDFLVSPLAIGVAILYQHFHSVGLFIALLPLLFIRRSYVTNLNLQRANRNLLKALVKAIETRDPYTSGHSMRVAALARRIGKELGLKGRAIADVETAALLHDIGKIEPIYSKILAKPGALSQEEREIIESHVTKGVEVLTSLASYPPAVLESVRHHHEREDGKGYPDGLVGTDIPLGARIIKVCDAVDAMLSDRPYRKALALRAVREQLETYSGTQFSPDIVECVTVQGVLEAHRETVLEASEAKEFLNIGSDESTVIQTGLSTIGRVRERLMGESP